MPPRGRAAGRSWSLPVSPSSTAEQQYGVAGFSYAPLLLTALALLVAAPARPIRLRAFLRCRHLRQLHFTHTERLFLVGAATAAFADHQPGYQRIVPKSIPLRLRWRPRRCASSRGGAWLRRERSCGVARKGDANTRKVRETASWCSRAGRISAAGENSTRSIFARRRPACSGCGPADCQVASVLGYLRPSYIPRYIPPKVDCEC